jgi:hypothetical protein
MRLSLKGGVQMPDVTDKQRPFVVKYPVDFNATQEALRAGYGPKTVRFIGAGSVCSNPGE